MTPNLKLQEAIDFMGKNIKCSPTEFYMYLNILISAAQSIMDKGEAKQMTVESLEQIIASNVPIEFIQVVEPFRRAIIYTNLATALFEAVYGGGKE
jgi:hypothetical protein